MRPSLGSSVWATGEFEFVDTDSEPDMMKNPDTKYGPAELAPTMIVVSVMMAGVAEALCGSVMAIAITIAPDTFNKDCFVGPAKNCRSSSQ
jgi:hypothetical protein